MEITVTWKRMSAFGMLEYSRGFVLYHRTAMNEQNICPVDNKLQQWTESMQSSYIMASLYISIHVCLHFRVDTAIPGDANILLMKRWISSPRSLTKKKTDCELSQISGDLMAIIVISGNVSGFKVMSVAI